MQQKSHLQQEQAIQPSKSLPEQHWGHTSGLDRSLGLDRYVFFHWGLPEKSTYGRNFLLLSPLLLTSPNTIVTPCDIDSIAYVDKTPFEQLAPERQRKYQEGYFDRMVTGKQWLEIVARKILRSYEKGNPFYNLYGASFLGEIKYLGNVSFDYIQRQISDKQLNEYYKFLYEHGFSFENIELSKRLFLNTGVKYGVDPLPEEFGVDYEEASKYWKKLLG